MQTAEAQKEAPKIEPVFDEDDVPAGKLDDAEIARLVSLSSQAAYHRTDNIPVKPKDSFEPRTLVTIAMEAQRRREAELKVPSADEEVTTATPHDVETADTAEATDNAASGDIAKESTVEVAASEAATAADTSGEDELLQSAGEVEADEAELTEEEIAAAAIAEKLQAEYQRGFTEGRAKGEEAGHKTGQDKGYEAGRAAGQAEATAQLETAIQGFEKATLALTSSAALDLDILTASIHDAILSLASERAGMAIAEMPDGFVSRIEDILATIKQGADQPQISLNPNDLVALKPIIATREKLQNCSLDSDETLAPGDVRLVIDGIGIEDELQRRVSRRATFQPAGALTEEGSNLTADAKVDIAETAPKEITASEPGDSGSTGAITVSNDVSGDNPTTPDAAREGGFSIGLKSSAEADDDKAPAADAADENGTDQS